MKRYLFLVIVFAFATLWFFKLPHVHALSWDISPTHIQLDNKCLGVAGNSKTSGSQVELASCDSSAGQVWIAEKGGYYNPNSTLCIDLPKMSGYKQLALESCGNLTGTTQADFGACGNLATEGDKVACFAAADWTQWQIGTPSHNYLLNKYTDGASFEEWCADFVSYVYKQAGYAFTRGETDGWNENIAARVQYMGFTKHMANSGYVPKTGDVAFFDYEGGHVEIVASGGKTPTFVYGNSAEIDPTTGNGQMKANTISKDGEEGQVVYYLTPQN